MLEIPNSTLSKMQNGGVELDINMIQIVIGPIFGAA